MEEKMFNKDYIEGMKFLLRVSKKQGVNIRVCTWIPHVSEMLSEHNLCHKFWYNVWSQKKLDRIPLCNDWFDVMFDPEKYLFAWCQSYEGYSFWASMLSKVLGVHVSRFSSYAFGASRRPLRD